MLIDPRSTDEPASAGLRSRTVGDLVATITLPRAELVGVARLVVGGAAARAHLGFEEVDDLQLAIETLVRAAFESAPEVVVRIESSADTLDVVVTPVPPERLAGRFDPTLELRTVLERLVDRVTTRTAPAPAIVLTIDLRPVVV